MMSGLINVHYCRSIHPLWTAGSQREKGNKRENEREGEGKRGREEERERDSVNACVFMHGNKL